MDASPGGWSWGDEPEPSFGELGGGAQRAQVSE